jgi:hypothetical protein
MQTNGDGQVREDLVAQAKRLIGELAREGATMREIEARFGSAGWRLARTERDVAIVAARKALVHDGAKKLMTR